jgi:hypothetical protein
MKRVILICALALASCTPRTTRTSLYPLGAQGVDGPINGTVGVLNFSSTARYFTSALHLSSYKASAFPTVLAAAQTALPIGNQALELGAPAQMMAIQQLANAGCKDMLAGESTTSSASRNFLMGISLAGGPLALFPDSLNGYFDALSLSFIGTPASDETKAILWEGYQAAALATQTIPGLAGNPTQQTLAALQIPCAALASSPRSVKL